MIKTDSGGIIYKEGDITKYLSGKEAGVKFPELVEEMSKYYIGVDTYEKRDPIVEEVRKKFLNRSQKGITAYGKTLEENNKYNYLTELQSELMDGALYIEKLLQQKEDITQLCEEYSNDTELGKFVRQKYSI